jgi:hypothetical protein
MVTDDVLSLLKVERSNHYAEDYPKAFLSRGYEIRWAGLFVVALC